MHKYFLTVISLFLVGIAFSVTPVKTPVVKVVPKYTVHIDSAKIYLCDSVWQHNYDTIIPFVTTTIKVDSLHHRHVDTLKTKR